VGRGGVLGDENKVHPGSHRGLVRWKKTLKIRGGQKGWKGGGLNQALYLRSSDYLFSGPGRGPKIEGKGGYFLYGAALKEMLKHSRF